MPRRRFSTLAFASLLACIAGPAHAQSPSIGGIFPAGGQAGATIATAITGTNLTGVRSVVVSGKGVQAEPQPGGSATSCPVQLRLAPDAEPGLREVRLVTESGASNAGRIWVGRYPSVLEKEPNDGRPEAQALATAPVTLDGRIEKATDTDRFSFDVAAGDTWVFNINAARHFSDLDAYLTLFDARGRSIAFAMEGFGRDPRLVHTFRDAGRYTVEVRDTLYRGGAGYTYRLSLGKLPVVTRWSPLGGQPGQTVNLALSGINLQGSTGLQVKLPSEPGRSTVRIIPTTPLGPAEPIDLFVESGPDMPEHEPNNDTKAANRPPALPVRASGWIGAQGDRDLYGVALREKQTVLVDVLARRLGSRLDGVLRILDPTGKELANNDDAVGKDPRLTFTAPAAGVYFAEVRSLSSRGGDGFFYRLKIGDPAPPDFALTVTPDHPTAPAGAGAVVTVTAQRAGYAGEIALRLENLPAGVTASAATIPAGQNSAVFTLNSPAGTAPAFSNLRITGAATIDGKNVEHAAQGQESYQPPLTTPEQRKTRETQLLLAAAGPALPFTLTVNPAAAEVPAGKTLELTVKATRQDKYKEAIAVTVAGLPPNVTASALTINGDKTDGKITLTTKNNTPVGMASLAVQGTAKTLISAAPAFSVKVLPAAK